MQLGQSFYAALRRTSCKLYLNKLASFSLLYDLFKTNSKKSELVVARHFQQTSQDSPPQAGALLNIMMEREKRCDKDNKEKEYLHVMD